MKPRNLFNTDDRAVSPVIGVILMVAITVILAAVIGTFVLGLGDSLGDNQPTAQISASLDIDATNNATVSIDHNGGDSIPAGEMRVVVSSDEAPDSAGTVDQRVSVGDSVSSALGGGETITAPEDVRIRVVHEPSDSILLDRTIQINDNIGDAGGDLEFSEA